MRATGWAAVVVALTLACGKTTGSQSGTGSSGSSKHTLHMHVSDLQRIQKAIDYLEFSADGASHSSARNRPKSKTLRSVF